MAAGKAAAANAMKNPGATLAKGFKNLVPCVPMAMLAWFDGGATFTTCMMKCLGLALGVAVAKMVYRLVKSCLWEIIKDALKGCFPADATVQLASGDTVPMLKLRIGDRVLTGDGTYSQVYVMSHQDGEHTAEFVELRLNRHTIAATEGHFLPVSKSCDGATEDLRARDVHVGMCLFARSAGESQNTLQEVLATQRVVKRGVFNPFTMHGTLAVNGIVASSHSDWFLDDLADSLGVTHMLPTIYQAVLAPARGLYSAVTWLAGVEAVREQLEEYKNDMADATEKNLVFKPYFDLVVRAIKLVTSKLVTCN